ncbi:MAG: mannose-1-phosphate guanylyltransferase/mannose-6-phosphate isomerase [Erythrobacter sp.]
MTDLIYPVLLCGGSGTRLWPLSRKSYPKQFAQIIGSESLFQQSARRLNGPGFAPPTVVTGNDFRFVVVEQLAACEIAPRSILIEPEGRNTGPAALAAALMLAAQDPQALMLLAPSDHVISDHEAFRKAVLAAAPRALAGDLVTFGIAPTRAETGYGYLELAKHADPCASEPQDLKAFVEKPDAERATEMLSSGRYLWNAGIFLFTADSLIKACKAYCPEILEPVEQAVNGAVHDIGFTRFAEEAWRKVPSISIDYAIMERADNLAVMPYAASWSDLGSWDAVWQESGPDDDGNVMSANALEIGCTNTLLRSESKRMEVVGIGLDDIVVVATSDAVLVARRSEAQQVKEAVAKLHQRGAAQAQAFPVDRRPWGWFESLVTGDRFQVKYIQVLPGAALSLQSHHHRAEHWIVVEGTASVTIGDTVQLLSENQSVYVPLGEKHRLENPGKVPLTLIEVQTGSYLGEDDIVRYDDRYARQ